MHMRVLTVQRYKIQQDRKLLLACPGAPRVDIYGRRQPGPADTPPGAPPPRLPALRPLQSLHRPGGRGVEQSASHEHRPTPKDAVSLFCTVAKQWGGGSDSSEHVRAAGETFQRPSPTDSNASNSTGELAVSPGLANRPSAAGTPPPSKPAGKPAAGRPAAKAAAGKAGSLAEARAAKAAARPEQAVRRSTPLHTQQHTPPREEAPRGKPAAAATTAKKPVPTPRSGRWAFKLRLTACCSCVFLQPCSAVGRNGTQCTEPTPSSH